MKIDDITPSLSFELESINAPNACIMPSEPCAMIEEIEGFPMVPNSLPFDLY